MNLLNNHRTEKGRCNAAGCCTMPRARGTGELTFFAAHHKQAHAFRSHLARCLMLEHAIGQRA